MRGMRVQRVLGLIVLGAGGLFAVDGNRRTLDECRALAEKLREQASHKQYAQAEQTCRQLIARLPRDPTSHYNLGCMLARQGRKEEAFSALEKAVSLGFLHIGQFRRDEDLASLRDDPRFEALLKKAGETLSRMPRIGRSIVPVTTHELPQVSWHKGTRPVPVLSSDPWRLLELPKPAATQLLYGVSFADALNGWIVGAAGLALSTTNGGRTWTVLDTGCHALLRAVTFGSNGVGWVCGDSDPDDQGRPVAGLAHVGYSRARLPATLLESPNGGLGWRRYWVPTNFEVGCVGWNGKTVVLGTSGGEDHRDGDLVAYTPGTGTRMTKGYRAVFGVAPCGSERWVAVGAPVSVGFRPTPVSPLFTADLCRALFSSDDGHSWNISRGSKPEKGRACLRAVTARPDGAVLAVGDGGEILASADAGETWTRRRSGETADLLGVAWGSSGRALAVGRRGVILLSEDGGMTWRHVDSSHRVEWRAVTAAGEDFVVVGGTGLALRVSGRRAGSVAR